jgi:hypothetical protein
MRLVFRLVTTMAILVQKPQPQLLFLVTTFALLAILAILATLATLATLALLVFLMLQLLRLQVLLFLDQ